MVGPFLTYVRGKVTLTLFTSENERIEFIRKCINDSALTHKPACGVALTIEYLTAKCQEKVSIDTLHTYLDQTYSSSTVDRKLLRMIGNGIIKVEKSGHLSLTL
ncbi:MAG: hypothetical protein WCV50_04040 [Patescibacteria group bacterium]